MVFILFLFLTVVHGLTVRENMEMKLQCKHICDKNKQTLACEKACFGALEHRMKHYPNLPEELKRSMEQHQKEKMIDTVVSVPVQKPPQVAIQTQKFIKPGREQNLVRR